MDSQKNTKRSVSMKLILPGRKKNSEVDDVNMRNSRILITVNVVGSSGPLRFVVNEDDKVSKIIDMSLKLYVREGRLPVLELGFKNFSLYASDAGTCEGTKPFNVSFLKHLIKYQ